MRKRRNDILEYVDKLVLKDRYREYEESRGVIIMRNGFVIQVPKMFNFFRDNWFFFQKVFIESDEEKREEFLKSTNNGVISNGMFSVDLNDVSVMISEDERSMLNFSPVGNEDEEIDEEDKGDSFTSLNFN